VNAAISEARQVVDQEAITALRSSDPGPCPVCGASGAHSWLRAPDRFHGRRDQYTLVRCPDCSLVWLVNAPQPHEMHAHYTDAYDRLISESGERSTARWDFRVEAVEQMKGAGALLDLGCSSGAFLNLLDKGRWELYGIEMSPESAKAAAARTGAKVFSGDILDVRFPPKSFDVITCFDVLEHLYEPRRILARVAEWLKPGGIFYVLVPNIDSAEGRVFGGYWHGLELPRHLFHYSPASLKFLAESVGLTEVSLKTRRNPAVGTSLRYVWDDVFRSVGIRKTPVAYRREPRVPWKAARKIVRLTLLRALLAMAPLAGSGESIHAIFRKDSAADGVNS
jgi:SAM-dependent methyltransferase